MAAAGWAARERDRVARGLEAGRRARRRTEEVLARVDAVPRARHADALKRSDRRRLEALLPRVLEELGGQPPAQQATEGRRMKLVTKAARARLARNGERPGAGHVPVVKVFNPYGAGTWLLSETSPEDADLAFGLCDPGLATPELGWIRISELEEVRVRVGGMRMPLERDLHFRPTRTLGEYAEHARKAQMVVAPLPGEGEPEETAAEEAHA